MPYEMIEHDGQFCLRKKGSDLMVKGSCHADKGETERMMRAMMANEKDMNGAYLLDDFVAVQPGEPYRLFPYGKLVKNGRTRLITPEMASRFRLPHFKPPVKLGSHDEATPAGGHIVGLEVRADGLYAVPEFTERGAQALADGAYRYHSPEVIWEGGGLEDPQTGDTIPGPLIVGDALLHTPHLGEAAALYSIEPIQPKEFVMTDEIVQVPKGLWDKFMAKLFPEPAPVTEPADPPAPEIPDEFKAAVVERDELKAKLAELEAEKGRTARLDAFSAQLAETKVAEGAEMLAGMSDEQAAWVVAQFKALSAQIDESALLGERGSSAGNDLPDNPRAKLDALAAAKAKEAKLDYVTALSAVINEQPELYRAAYPRKE